MDPKRLERITLEPGKRGGKPCIRGMRITVYDILGWLASGMSTQEILADYPELEADDVTACLAFAAAREQRIGRVAACDAEENPVEGLSPNGIGLPR